MDVLKNRIIVSALFAILLFSCDFQNPDSSWEGELGGGVIEENSILFGSTDTPGECLFETNEDRYSIPYGKSFWFPTSNVQDPFTEWSVGVVKESGREEAGFGLVFCDQGGSMLTVMIRIDGSYQVAEVVGTDYRPFDVWHTHSAIHDGYGMYNLIRVSRGVGGEFTLWINGREVRRFVDDEAPIHSSGRQGYLVITSPLEDFPQKPVIVRFRE